MSDPVLGLDVSSWQRPNSMRWAKLRELGYSFVYIRGVRMGRELDTAAHDHVRNAREAGFSVGLYGFFDPRHSAERQIELAHEAHRICGIGVGDLAPALDVESINDGPQACPAWVAPAAAILVALAAEYGAAVRYHNVVDWGALGAPETLERYPLWLASYSAHPLMPCAIWQLRAAPIDGCGIVALDQNRAFSALPVIAAPRATTCEPAPTPVPYPRYDADAHARARNEHVASDTDAGRHG